MVRIENALFGLVVSVTLMPTLCFAKTGEYDLSKSPIKADWKVCKVMGECIDVTWCGRPDAINGPPAAINRKFEKAFHKAEHERFPIHCDGSHGIPIVDCVKGQCTLLSDKEKSK